MVTVMQNSSEDEILPSTSQFAQPPTGHDAIRNHVRTPELAEHDARRLPSIALPHAEILPQTRQHDYPDTASRARAWYGLPQPTQSSRRKGNDEPSYERSFSPPDPDRDVSKQARPGFRKLLTDYWSDLKGDYGASERNLARTNSIGDTGIDIRALRRLQRRARISNLVGSSLSLSSPALGQGVPTAHSRSGSESGSETSNTPWKRQELGFHSGDVSRALHTLKDQIGHSKETKEAKYVQIKGEVAVRRSVVLRLTYCFMLYGAPSHRIEDYVINLFEALDLDGRVNYIVGCTEICFINALHPSDPTTRYSYTTLVKAQGLDVGRLGLSFRLYKDLIHGEISLEEAETKLVDLIDSPPFYKPWFLVPLYGVASALLSVWAFKGYWTDMSAAFALGSLVGVLQIVVTSRNPLYTNVLEVTAAVITSFGARAFASIGGSDQRYFCFAAIAESSIATLLPGYIVLCGALELQSKSVTAGSTRLFYAVIYSLFLGYGINVGSQLWAVIYPNAPTSAICPRGVDPRWKIVLVPTYLVVQAMLIRSRPIQIPLQVLFGSAAYTVDYFVSQSATAQIADTASAFTLGVLGHLYSRSRHGFAFASIIAGIMVLVPGGIAAQGGLISGITVPLFSNETVNAQQIYADNQYQSFSVGAQMIQVAVGLSVGLLISALAIYPLGRKNNALFSF